LAIAPEAGSVLRRSKPAQELHTDDFAVTERRIGVVLIVHRAPVVIEGGAQPDDTSTESLGARKDLDLRGSSFGPPEAERTCVYGNSRLALEPQD
jgi:hypothetical protein